MNQFKGGTANAEIDASKAMSKHNSPSSILISSKEDKLGSKPQGKVLLEIARDNENSQLYFRIAG